MSDSPFSIVKDSSARNLLFNKVWLQGIVLRGIFYGIAFALSCSCIRLLLSRRSRSANAPPRNKWLLAYVIFILLISTTTMVFGGIQNEEAYIFHPDFPGGPAAFELGSPSIVHNAESLCFIFLQWAADGLLIWRCLIFFTTMSFEYIFYIRVFFGIIVVLDIGLSVMFVIANTPVTLGSQAQELNIILAYGIFTMVLNLGITAAITTKLIQHNHSVAPLLGHNSTKYHFGIISVFIESAAVLTIHNIFFIVPAIMRHPLSVVGYHIGIMVQVIPPLMIIQRVARGIAWDGGSHSLDELETKHSQLEFADPTQLPDLELLQ